jgi:NADH-quinone oxidoreductase subunit L
MLFLAAGIVIHELGNEQDIRLMGGMAKRTKLAAVAMSVGTLSICGIPPFSGFFSKDAILYATLTHGHPYLFAIGALTAALTAYYMFRMLFVVFTGTYRGEVDPSDLGIRHPELVGTTPPVHAAHAHQEHHAHAPAWIMALPVAILVLPSAFIGLLGFGGESSAWTQYWGTFFSDTTHDSAAALSESDTTGIVLVLVLAGIATAWWRYARAGARNAAVVRLREESIRMPALLSHAFYFDAAIDALFVKPAQRIGRYCDAIFETHVIDGAIHELAIGTRMLGHFFRSLETGFVRAYALILAFGVAFCAAWYGFAVGAFVR